MAETYAEKLARVNDRIAERGIPRTEAARMIGYDSHAGYQYVRSVLAGGSTSRPVLDKIERALDGATEPARAAAGGDG